jgi:protein-S-isoprenylcysteine O-methyltransferase Ste14
VKATRFEFRFRVVIISALYFIGFYAPWERLGPSGNPNPMRLWSWLAIEAARASVLSTSVVAYIAITIAAVVLAVLGAWLRVWGTAYLGHFVMRNKTMQAGALMASGPYRHLRNPLYIGLLLNSFAVSILMPVTGALFFLVGITVFTLRLIGAEEAFLTGQLGDDYAEYCKTVPSIFPSLRSRLGESSARPRWLQSLLAEVYPVGTAVCFAALAWNYDADLLTRCVIVCFGASLIVRALTSSRGQAPAEVT